MTVEVKYFSVCYSANASVNSRDEHCDTCTETESVLSSRRGRYRNVYNVIVVLGRIE